MSLWQFFGWHSLWVSWTNIVMENGWWVSPLTKTLPYLVNNLWWNVVVDDWNLVENHLVSDSNCNNVYLQSPDTYIYIYICFNFLLQGMTNNVGLTISVGDTIPRFAINIGDTKGRFTHEPRAVTMTMWEPKRKCRKAVPRHLKSWNVITDPQV